MSDLPKGWASAALQELAGPAGLMDDGDWIESKDQDPNGDVRLIQLADIGDGHFANKSSRFLTNAKAIELRCTFLQPSDLLIARMPDPLGRSCIFPDIGLPAVTAVDVCIWRPTSGTVDARWLMHFVNSPEVRESIQSQASGTTRRRISGGNLKRLPIPVPPAEEQRRLVARLDSLRARSSRARQELDHIPKLIERYKQAILAKGFSGSDDAEEVALGDLIADGPQNGLYLPKSQYGDGTPILRIENYGFDGAEPMTAWSRVKIESDIAAKYALAPGDIVINRVNSPSHLGKSLLVLDAHVPAVFESNMMRMRLSDSVLPEYVQLFLGSEMGRKQLIADAKWAVNQASINQGDVCRIIVPLPSIATQSRVIAEIRVAMAWLDKIATEHARAEHLLPKLDQAVLAKAFRGELVPQDPNDEPASVLLERIKAARAGKAPEKRRRPKS